MNPILIGSFVIGSLVLFLCTPISAATLDTVEQEACMILFEDIIEIQTTRNELGLEMHKAGEQRATRKISKRKFQKTFKVWLAKENALATQANELYLKGDEAGCFETLEQKAE